NNNSSRLCSICLLPLCNSVQLTRAPSQSLGISIMGGRGMGRRLNSGEMMRAIEDGRLKRGDQIIAVNGHCLEGVTHAEAVEILKKTKGTVSMKPPNFAPSAFLPFCCPGSKSCSSCVLPVSLFSCFIASCSFCIFSLKFSPSLTKLSCRCFEMLFQHFHMMLL
uniref:PDZ domain-containing protein n=1 Tax=Xiphophorus couchianus TaxID=32473 RepID=A0A3B5M444_9TELE